MLYKTLFLRVSMKRYPISEKIQQCRGKAHGLPQLWQLGRCSIFPSVLTLMEKKSPPSFLLSCSARQTALYRVVSQRRMSVSGAAEGWGAAGQGAA